MVTRAINTTIPKEYHTRGILNEVCWSKAICLGIDILTNDCYINKIKLMEKIKELKNETKIFEKRLIELNIKEKEELARQEKDQDLKNNYCCFCFERLTPKNTKIYNGVKFCKSCFLGNNFEVLKTEQQDKNSLNTPRGEATFPL